MSKNIIIKTDGTSTIYTDVEKIRVPLPDGGSEDWVPEDERQCGTIEIQQNGVYNMEGLEIYGAHTAIIRVPKGKAIAGYGQDGKAYIVKKDSETGQLTKTEIPTRIEITKRPTETHYAEGEPIDYTGLVVTLKGKDGETFTDSTYTTGVVPISELTLTAGTAERTKTKIPVLWLSPYTSRVLKATFTITVTEASE